MIWNHWLDNRMGIQPIATLLYQHPKVLLWGLSLTWSISGKTDWQNKKTKVMIVSSSSFKANCSHSLLHWGAVMSLLFPVAWGSDVCELPYFMSQVCVTKFISVLSLHCFNNCFQDSLYMLVPECQSILGFTALRDMDVAVVSVTRRTVGRADHLYLAPVGIPTTNCQFLQARCLSCCRTNGIKALKTLIV